MEQKEQKPVVHHHEHAASSTEKLSMLLISIVALIILFNQFQISQVSGMLTGGSASKSGPTTDAISGGVKLDATGDVTNEVIKTLIPTGVPKDYGSEVGVSFDDPVTSLSILARLDRAVATSSLSADQKARYIGIDEKISCEFCCGALGAVDSAGRDSCGCSHSAAIRGLTKYIITTHPDWTDEQIKWELTRWKSMFYPRNMVEKGVALASNGMELSPDALNDRDLLKKISSGNTGDIGSLPNMVGGC
jgi:hypothetical protein